MFELSIISIIKMLYSLSDDCLAIGSIHRQDCADLVAKALTSPKTERQVLSAIDPSIITAVNPDARPITEFALS